ncbi:hypothetical protein [Streptomyces sp. NBC_00102]|uniref:hypothetical protein n=1 Tax=Streptomyces sp. NBC_00102 TaxID=2975652 RepID=UPI0022570B54|nr:hypothetical protein [Streptomyces sp. NBC_00102]MCX5400648.1 hypothetical protein [Streptomyces sp. NBC_00102]
MALTSRHSSARTPRSTGSTGPSAVETNEAIRALVDSRAGRDWSCDAYEVLLIEWAAATRGPGTEIVEAA